MLSQATGLQMQLFPSTTLNKVENERKFELVLTSHGYRLRHIASSRLQIAVLGLAFSRPRFISFP